MAVIKHLFKQSFSRKINNMARLWAFIIILLPLLVQSQTKPIEVKGLILDEFKTPIPYVAVGIVDKNIGIASTEDGEFSFLISNSELQDTLTISSLGFDSFKIIVEEYLKLDDKTIVLSETTTELNEVYVLSPMGYVLSAMKHLKDNTLSDPHKLEILYRRATTENKRPKFFVENYLHVRDKGPAYPPGIVQVLEGRKSADYRIFKGTQWQHSINALFNVNPLRPHNSQHSRNLKKFDWKRIGDSSYEGEDVMIIQGQNPKIDWERITFYIGIDSFKVYRIERGPSLFVYKKHNSGKLVLSYFKNEWKLKKYMIPERFHGTDAEISHYKTEAFISNISTDKKEYRRIYPYGIDTDMGKLELPYNADFWKNLNMPPDTKFYQRIKEGLEGNFGVSLEQQYELVNR